MRAGLGHIRVLAVIAVATVASLESSGHIIAARLDRPVETSATRHADAFPETMVTSGQSEPRFQDNKNYKHHWMDVDGVKAHYIEAGSGPVLILVHGALAWSSAEANYGNVVGPLSKHFRVIAPDVVGFGYTAPRGPQDYTGQAQGDFLIHFIEALHLGSIFIEGNSHGGFLTQYVVLERPGLVKKLIITNSLDGTSPNRPPMSDTEKIPLQSQTEDQIRQMLLRYYKHSDLVTDERVRLVHDIYQRNYKYYNSRNAAVFTSNERYNQNLSYKGKHISEWGAQLKIPLLLVWSEPGSRLEWGLGYLARVPGSEMHILPWSGHHLFTDQSARWAQVVTDWLLNEPPRPPN